MNRPKDGWKRGRDSAHVMRVYWRTLENGRKSSSYYSFDWKTSHSRTRNDELGLQRLISFAVTIGNRATAVLIYQTATNLLVVKFVNGIRQLNLNS